MKMICTALAIATLVPAATAVPSPKAKPVAAKVAPKGATLSMKQVTITVDPAADGKTNGAKIAAFQTAMHSIFSCGDVAGVAKSVGATVETNERLPFATLPPKLQATVRTMKVGTATQMFGDRETGKISVLVLCTRT